MACENATMQQFNTWECNTVLQAHLQVSHGGAVSQVGAAGGLAGRLPGGAGSCRRAWVPGEAAMHGWQRAWVGWVKRCRCCCCSHRTRLMLARLLFATQDETSICHRTTVFLLCRLQKTMPAARAGQPRRCQVRSCACRRCSTATKSTWQVGLPCPWQLARWLFTAWLLVGGLWEGHTYYCLCLQIAHAQCPIWALR
jgi:hypothetical protein